MPLTPVNLAELTGLTAGAITAVADRLEAAGFVERVRSHTDRRRWELRLVPERQKDQDALFEPLDQRHGRTVPRATTTTSSTW